MRHKLALRVGIGTNSKGCAFCGVPDGETEPPVKFFLEDSGAHVCHSCGSYHEPQLGELLGVSAGIIDDLAPWEPAK